MRAGAAVTMAECAGGAPAGCRCTRGYLASITILGADSGPVKRGTDGGVKKLPNLWIFTMLISLWWRRTRFVQLKRAPIKFN